MTMKQQAPTINSGVALRVDLLIMMVLATTVSVGVRLGGAETVGKLVGETEGDELGAALGDADG